MGLWYRWGILRILAGEQVMDPEIQRRVREMLARSRQQVGTAIQSAGESETIPITVDPNGDPNHIPETPKGLTFGEKVRVKRLVNTLLTMSIAVGSQPEPKPFERITNHPDYIRHEAFYNAIKEMETIWGYDIISEAIEEWEEVNGKHDVPTIDVTDRSMDDYGYGWTKPNVGGPPKVSDVFPQVPVSKYPDTDWGKLYRDDQTPRNNAMVEYYEELLRQREMLRASQIKVPNTEEIRKMLGLE